MRLDRNSYYMQIAISASRRSTCPKRNVGCVIVANDRVLSTGYNGAPSGCPHCENKGCLFNAEGKCVRSVHAEINAIAQLPHLSISRLDAVQIFVTDAPCLRCLQAISAIPAERISVYYLKPYDCPDRDLFYVEVCQKGRFVNMYQLQESELRLGDDRGTI